MSINNLSKLALSLLFILALRFQLEELVAFFYLWLQLIKHSFPFHELLLMIIETHSWEVFCSLLPFGLLLRSIHWVVCHAWNFIWLRFSFRLLIFFLGLFLLLLWLHLLTLFFIFDFSLEVLDHLLELVKLLIVLILRLPSLLPDNLAEQLLFHFLFLDFFQIFSCLQD